MRVDCKTELNLQQIPHFTKWSARLLTGRLHFAFTQKGVMIMRNPYENYIRMELLSLALAVVIGLIAIVQGYVMIMLFCLYLLAFSILSEGTFYLNTNKTPEGIKQFVRAGMLLVLATVLFFYII